MTRAEKLAKIEHEFDKTYLVSIDPDLPNLFAGPDLLAGGNGQLIAVFTPRSTEQRHPGRLLARLGLSRLALPGSSRCVLAVDTGDVQRGFTGGSLSSHFHAFVNIERRISLANLQAETEATESRHHIPETIRRRVFARSSFLFALSVGESESTDYREIRERPAPDAEFSTSPVRTQANSLDDLRHQIQTKHSAFAHLVTVATRNVVVAHSRLSEPVSMRRILEPLTYPIFELNFSMDNGVPYRRADVAGVLHVESLPANRKDPIKELRAAAFAGWAVLVDHKQEDVTRATELISSWLERSNDE